MTERREFRSRAEHADLDALRDASRILIRLKLAAAVVSALAIAGHALSGPIEQTGAVFYFTIIPIGFLAAAGRDLLFCAASGWWGRLLHRNDAAGRSTLPFRVAGVAAIVAVLHLFMSGFLGRGYLRNALLSGNWLSGLIVFGPYAGIAALFLLSFRSDPGPGTAPAETAEEPDAWSEARRATTRRRILLIYGVSAALGAAILAWYFLVQAPSARIGG